jgi:insulysin
MYSYLSLLRSTKVPPWAFEEFRSLGEIRFRFTAESPPEGYVSRLAEIMARPWPRERLLSGSSKVWIDQPDLWRNFLEVDMAPEKGSVLLCSKDFIDTGIDGPWTKEKWYGTEYMIQKMDPAILKMVRSPVFP